MAKFAWSPRSFLVEPKNFSHFKGVAWHTDRPATGEGERVPFTVREQDQLQAAQWQHLVCYYVRDAAQWRGVTIDQVAEETRMGRDQFWRLMRGDGPMRLEDFAAMKRALGIKFNVLSDEPSRAGADSEP